MKNKNVKTVIHDGSLGKCKASMIKWIAIPVQFKHYCCIQQFTKGINRRNVVKTMMIELIDCQLLVIIGKNISMQQMH